MSLDENNNVNTISLPDGSWEEFLGALEAASGCSRKVVWRDPMSPDQVREALDNILLSERPDRGLDVLVRSGTMAIVLPEVQALVGFGEGIRHKDVWLHTKQIIRQTPQRAIVRWAALLHDIGKVPTRRFEDDGQVTFIGHPEVGARMYKKIAGRLPFDDSSYQSLYFLIAGHLRAAAYEDSWTDSAVRRFARHAGDDLTDLLDLARADITSKYAEKVRRGLRQINTLSDRVDRILAQDAKPAPLPKGLGSVLIQRLGIAPGPGLGRLMDALKTEVEAGNLGVQQDHEHYVAYVENNPALLEML